jgi:protein-disulfide isomerase
MNQRLASTSLVLALSLAGCAAPFQPSRHYTAVTKHLDVGGDVLFYADVDGDLAAGADTLDRLLDRVRKGYPDSGLERLKAKTMLNQLGLDQVTALGLSSAREGKAFHNKAFLAYGQDRRGLLLFTGAPPRTFEIPGQAPADVDVVFESDLKLKSLLNLVEAMSKDILGKDVSNKLFSGLNEKLPGVALTTRDVLDRLDTRLVGLVRVNEQRTFTAGKYVLPSFDVLLSLDNMGEIFDAYRGLLQAMPGVTSTTENGMLWLELSEDVPGVPGLRPVLTRDMKSGRVFLATSKGFVKEFLAPKGGDKPALAKTADWKRATARFESKGNGISFVSGAFMGKVARFARPLGKESEASQIVVDAFLELLPDPGIPLATQQTNLPDGLSYASYATTSHKSTLLPAVAAGPVMLAGAIAGVAKYAIGRRAFAAAHGSSDEAEEIPADEVGMAPAEAIVYRVEIDGAPVRGAKDALVTIVMFSDYQCPFCKRVEPTMEKLLVQHKGDVRVVWRDLPLGFHPRAKRAAQAARAAGEQGKYWEMHDKLIGSGVEPAHLEEADIERYVHELRLNKKAFKAALERPALARAVEQDVQQGSKLGVTGTPVFFINGRRLSGAQPYEKFERLVEQELKAARERVAKGTPRAKVYEAIMREAQAEPGKFRF